MNRKVVIKKLTFFFNLTFETQRHIKIDLEKQYGREAYDHSFDKLDDFITFDAGYDMSILFFVTIC